MAEKYGDGARSHRSAFCSDAKDLSKDQRTEKLILDSDYIEARSFPQSVHHS